MQQSTKSTRNKMPGLRQKGCIWHIEKRCRYAQGGWLRESTGTSSRIEAEQILIRRLAELEQAASRRDDAIFTFEQAGLRYLEEIAHKRSADTVATLLDRLFNFIGEKALAMVHDGSLKSFVDSERARGLAPKSINNAIGVVSAVLNRAARVWRTEEGVPWLAQAPPKLTRLSLIGKQARAYPLSWKEQDRLFRLLPRYLADAALFAVNTGCRESEVCKLKWDWEVKVPALESSVFVLPESETKTATERVIVLNRFAKQVIDCRRGKHDEFVFTYRGIGIKRLHNTSWKRAWRQAELPVEPGILRGVHNLRHTFGRRLRGEGIPLETRKALLGHAGGDITTHYSAAELKELITAVESIANRNSTNSPTLTLVSRRQTNDCRKSVGSIQDKG